MAKEMQAQGLKVLRYAIPHRNHMSSVRDLGVPGSATAGRLTDLIARH